MSNTERSRYLSGREVGKTTGELLTEGVIDIDDLPYEKDYTTEELEEMSPPVLRLISFTNQLAESLNQGQFKVFKPKWLGFVPQPNLQPLSSKAFQQYIRFFYQPKYGRARSDRLKPTYLVLLDRYSSIKPYNELP